MNKEAFIHGMTKGADDALMAALIPGLVAGTLAGGSMAYSRTPKKSKEKKAPISIPAAALTGLLAPAGPLIHGAIVDRRNRTGQMNNKFAPDARMNLWGGSMLGGLGGGAIGGGLGSLLGNGQGAALGALAGVALGLTGGGALGAHRYNKKAKL